MPRFLETSRKTQYFVFRVGYLGLNIFTVSELSNSVLCCLWLSANSPIQCLNLQEAPLLHFCLKAHGISLVGCQFLHLRPAFTIGHSDPNLHFSMTGEASGAAGAGFSSTFGNGSPTF